MEDNFFYSFFKETSLPSIYFTKVDDKSLERYRKVVIEVNKKNKSTTCKIDYDVLEQKLTITGTALDLFYFGYYTKESQ